MDDLIPISRLEDDIFYREDFPRSGTILPFLGIFI
jgi:hypothetical protein